MSGAAYDFHQLAGMLSGREQADVACPRCGPDRREPRNRLRPVLRLWRRPGFISWHCARCVESGYVRDGDGRRPIDQEAWQRQSAEIARRDTEAKAVQLKKGLALWRARRPVEGTPAERYLRSARGITCQLPATLGYLPPRGDHPPAMIAAFAFADEAEPGVLAPPEVILGLQITRLKPDGSGKAEEPAKIMLGRLATVAPIVLAPPSDFLGLVITEGIEDALSVHQATGLGAWAAGSASRMPALADVLPDWIDCVTIMVDDDDAGRKHSLELARRLGGRGIHAELRELGARA